jgi:hypothetical protein
VPIEPSHGNYYEAGLSKVFGEKIKIDANYFRRLVSNYADVHQLADTSIGFPNAFRNALIYGAEAKPELPDLRHFSGFLSDSYTDGQVWPPVTGGPFLGADATAARALTGHFPDSQDQRNTVRGRLLYHIKPRCWIAGGIQYDTGLPLSRRVLRFTSRIASMCGSGSTDKTSAMSWM